MLTHQPMCVLSLLRNSVADYMPNSSQCPQFHSLHDKLKNSQKSQEIIVNLKKCGRLWHNFYDACRSLWKLCIYFTGYFKTCQFITVSFTSWVFPPISLLSFWPLGALQVHTSNVHIMYALCSTDAAVCSADQKAALSTRYLIQSLP